MGLHGILVHEKQAKITKIRAPMIRSFSFKQLTIVEFDWPFQTDLDENNRWVKMSQCIPWDELAEFYYQELSAETGRPAVRQKMLAWSLVRSLSITSSVYLM